MLQNNYIPTEEEYDSLQEAVNQYWLEFSALVDTTLSTAPDHLKDLLEVKLQESSSVYGRHRD